MAVAGFLNELKRRKVFRVALLYTGVAWLVLQFADVVSEPLGLPPWFINAVLVFSAIGFPIALILSWVFDITADGVQRADPSLDASQHPALSLAHSLSSFLFCPDMAAAASYHQRVFRRPLRKI